MICPTCRRETPADRPFCLNCGAVLPELPPHLEREGMSPGARAALLTIGGGAASLCLLCAGLIVVTEVPDLVGLVLSALLALIPTAIYVSLVLWVDRYEHEPARLLFFAFFWGAVVAVVFSYVFNSIVALIAAQVVGTDGAEIATAVLSAPVVEEAFKGVFLLLLMLLFRHEFDNILDGIVYGSIVGLGFAMTENLIYFGRAYAEGGLADLALIVVLRAILGGFSHALYTGTIGAGLGLARESRRLAVKLIAPLAGYLLAVGQHGAWNLIAGAVVPAMLPPETAAWVYFCLVAPVQTVVLTGPGLLTLAIIVLITWQREAAIIRQMLLPEVEQGLLSREDYQILSSSRRRIQSLWATLRNDGFVALLLRRDYINAATELAFRKWHLARGERPKRGQRFTPEEQYREKIRRLQARLALQ
ncbi:MAG: PrsW family intramembrane metalloprotease [Chloroflexota bacterium]|nr:PrsW family glutamic-type intramembrane protease [Dehalococcoidia bacterium]MDW8253981.1 PrsW family intramembrane metalloprotease [Chloroflexota bacterium]